MKTLRKCLAILRKKGLKKALLLLLNAWRKYHAIPVKQHAAEKCIKVGDPITNLPVLADESACNGCGNCVIKCPGLAIFVVDKTYSKDEASIAIPYEILPLPVKGSSVVCLDRKGNEVCDGTILKVMSGKALNKTNIVTIAVPKEYADIVRFFKIKETN